jgi:outer membrane receptor for ferric coprogen and ferric-rhodotorulic acid
VEYQKGLADSRSSLALGLDLRYTDARVLQDFDAEPFSRRDLSLADISDNSIVPSGGAVNPLTGNRYWSTFGTASIESELVQSAVYASGSFGLGERLTLYYGGRLERADYEGGLPREVDNLFRPRESYDFDGQETLWQLNLNPHMEILPGVFAYGALQVGKALAPGDGGTVSGPETFTDVELFEGGLKAGLFDGTLFTSLSLYHWDQATYSTRDASARPLRAKGLEWEWTWSPLDTLTLLGSFAAQRVYLRTDTLGFGALPQTEQGWALNGGILNAAGGRTAPDNPDMVFAGLPEVSAHLYAAWEFADGFQLAGGPLWRDGFYHDMQRALRIPGHIVWMAQLRHDADRWWVRLHVENLFDKAYWIGQEPVFSAGTLILQGPGRKWELSAGLRF